MEINDIGQNLQFIGLIYDAVGILVLGIPFVTKSLDTVLEEAGTSWDYSPPIARSQVLQRLDTRIGTALLVVGFLLQAGAQICHQVPFSVGATLLLLLVLTISIYYAALRPRLRERHLEMVRAKYDQLSKRP